MDKISTIFSFFFSSFFYFSFLFLYFLFFFFFLHFSVSKCTTEMDYTIKWAFNWRPWRLAPYADGRRRSRSSGSSSTLTSLARLSRASWIGCCAASTFSGSASAVAAENGERISQHNDLCNVLFPTARKANLGPAREYRGLIPGSSAPPADIFLINLIRGREAALDVSFISPMQVAVIEQEASNPGSG